MKLLHLSDLHLGKRVNEISMLEDQKYILAQILQILDEESPDAVLLAGDIYDKTVPSAEAVSLFDDFLVQLCARKIPVLVISGNHDCAERLAFASRLLEHSNIHISPAYDGTVRSLTLSDSHGEVVFHLLPFLKPAQVRRHFPDARIETYTDACRAAISAMSIDGTRRNVLLAHQFVTGSATCESEEISVGGSDNVDASVFDPFDYVALGHLHGPQNVLSPRLRYCGTMLKYSFSEEHHHKSVTLVTLGEKGDLQLHLRPLTPLHDLRTLRGSFEELSAPAFYEAQNTLDYLHIVLTDEEDIPEAVGKLRAVYPNLMKLTYDNTRTRSCTAIDAAAISHRSPLELFGELYELQNNRPFTDAQLQYLQNLMELPEERL